MFPTMLPLPDTAMPLPHHRRILTPTGTLLGGEGLEHIAGMKQMAPAWMSEGPSMLVLTETSDPRTVSL